MCETPLDELFRQCVVVLRREFPTFDTKAITFTVTIVNHDELAGGAAYMQDTGRATRRTA